MKEELICVTQQFKNDSIIWSFELQKMDREHSYNYAYYIWKEQGIIQRFPYQELTTSKFIIDYSIVESGVYKCQVFIKKRTTLLINKNTEICAVDKKNKELLETRFYNEHIYFNDLPIRYVFHESPIKSDILVVCFSGISSMDFQGGKPVYNYIKTLEGLPVHRLYILDEFQNKFCYYLGKQGNREFERSVNALITTKANELEVPSQNIVSVGSSKGGTAALYYSLTYNYGHTIVGAPQIRISDFLKGLSKNVYMQEVFYFLHGENEALLADYYNNLLYTRMVENRKKPEMFFHIGDEDYHYQEHLVPFLNYCDSLRIPYNLDIQSYSDHSQTGTFFSPFLRNTMVKLINKKRASDEISY